MSKPKEQRVINWGHLALLGIIVLVVLSYLLDARATSLKINNLLLVQPAAIFALVLVALILPQIFPKLPASDVPDAAERRRTRLEAARVAMLAFAFGLFVFSLETVGFDIATFCFMAVGLYVCGERRFWVVGAYSTAFTALVIYGYQQLVPYPFPMTVL